MTGGKIVDRPVSHILRGGTAAADRNLDLATLRHDRDLARAGEDSLPNFAPRLHGNAVHGAYWITRSKLIELCRVRRGRSRADRRAG